MRGLIMGSEEIRWRRWIRGDQGISNQRKILFSTKEKEMEGTGSGWLPDLWVDLPSQRSRFLIVSNSGGLAQLSPSCPSFILLLIGRILSFPKAFRLPMHFEPLLLEIMRRGRGLTRSLLWALSREHFRALLEIFSHLDARTRPLFSHSGEDEDERWGSDCSPPPLSSYWEDQIRSRDRRSAPPLPFFFKNILLMQTSWRKRKVNLGNGKSRSRRGKMKDERVLQILEHILS